MLNYQRVNHDKPWHIASHSPADPPVAHLPAPPGARPRCCGAASSPAASAGRRWSAAGDGRRCRGDEGSPGGKADGKAGAKKMIPERYIYIYTEYVYIYIYIYVECVCVYIYIFIEHTIGGIMLFQFEILSIKYIYPIYSWVNWLCLLASYLHEIYSGYICLVLPTYIHREFIPGEW